MVSLLIKSGCEVNVFDINKKDPLQIAFDNKQCEMIKVFVKAGGAVNTRNRRGRSLLFFACDYDDFDLIKIV